MTRRSEAGDPAGDAPGRAAVRHWRPWRWNPPGGCKLDFRHAELSSAITQVNAVAVMGGVSDPPDPAMEDTAPRVEEVVAAGGPLLLEGTTVTLMFTDVIESTVMAQSLGDHRWFEVLQRHNALLRGSSVILASRIARRPDPRLSGQWRVHDVRWS